MKKNIGEEFVRLLRTTKGERATERLRLDNDRCAIGLLCDAYKKVTGKGRWVRYNDHCLSEKNDAGRKMYRFAVSGNDGPCIAALSNKLRAEIGISREAMWRIIMQSDDYVPFSVIADDVETNLMSSAGRD